MATSNLTSAQTLPNLTVAERGYQAWQERSIRAASQVRSIMDHYRPISLGEMEGVALLSRTDTKFVLHLDQLSEALQCLGHKYRVLEISRRRLHAYHNLYFDTPNFTLFDQHHRGMRDRYKVRCREYVDSDLTYLEVKRKNNRNRTIKSRLQTPAFVDHLCQYRADFLQHHYPFSSRSLSPVLWNDFHRITLVSTQAVERLTLDINLSFSDGWSQAGLPGVAVAEVKQDGFSVHSDFISQMRDFRVPPQRFSKYCMGICLFYPGLKTNNFKPRTLLVERIMRGG